MLCFMCFFTSSTEKLPDSNHVSLGFLVDPEKRDGNIDLVFLNDVVMKIKPVIERDHDKDRQPEGEAGGEECIGFVHLKVIFPPKYMKVKVCFPN